MDLKGNGEKLSDIGFQKPCCVIYLFANLSLISFSIVFYFFEVYCLR